MKIVALNKKALFDYEILDKIEVGIVLSGDEVKSARAGNVSLIGSFATFHNGELYLINCRFTPYAQAYTKDEEQATRRRKLLLHRRELNRLVGEISRKGVTLVPLRMYFSSSNRIKVELGVGKHKKAISKKQDIKERDIKRQTRRELRGKYEY